MDEQESELKGWLRYLLAIAATLAGACLIVLVLSPSARADSLWVTSGMWSKHPNEGHYHYLQQNTGWGLAYEQPERRMTWILGDYENSLYQNSKYIGVIHDPWNIGPVHIGYLAGFVSGYSKTPTFLPAAAPVASVEYKSVGFNVVWVPSVVVAVQVKVKVW